MNLHVCVYSQEIQSRNRWPTKKKIEKPSAVRERESNFLDHARVQKAHTQKQQRKKAL